MIEEDPRIDPAGLRDARFPGSFRRYDSKAVDDFLESVADRVVATNELIDDLRRQLADARDRPPDEPPAERSPFDAPDLTTLSEDELVQLIGEETTHVLSTARKAAAEIRSKAEESAARLIREATAEATELTESAEAEALELTTEASTARDTAVATAEAEAEEIRAAAVAEAEQLVADGKAEVEALEASMEEARLRAEEEAERLIEDAKDEGRAMVAEAKKLRTRILEDLQRRRDLGRTQVERLAAGRDQLLEAYAAVRSNLDEITGRLELGLLEMTSPSHDPLLDDGFSGIVISRMIEEEADDAEQGSDEADVDDVRVEDAGAADEEIGATDDAVGSDGEASTIDGSEAGDVGAAADEPDVDALFARLRAERAESVTRAQGVLDDEGTADAGGQPAGDTDDTDTADDTDGTADAGGTDDPEVTDDTAEKEVTGGTADEEDEESEESDDSDGGPGTDRVPTELLADPDALAQRSEVIGALDKKLARALKRHLADEQNRVLDSLRRTESTEPDELFPPLDEHAAGYAGVAAVQLTAAAEAGAAHVGERVEVDVTALAGQLGTSLIESFRRRIDRSASEVDGDADALDERLRALYREWKVEHIGAATTDALLSAYAVGQHAAAPEGSSLRWLIDPDQGPCPDAQDNALAGAVPKGEPFPTGDGCPQAHPGCRCLLVVEG